MTMNNLEMKSLWQDLPAMSVSITPQEIAAQADKTLKSHRRGIAIEYTACLLAIVVSTFFIWSGDTVLRQVGATLLLIGTLIAAWQLHRRASGNDSSDHSVLSDIVTFQVAELSRLKDAIKSAWIWYICPIVPGIGVWILDYWVRMSDGSFSDGERLTTVILVTAFTVTGFVGVALYQLLYAAYLQRQIDHLRRAQAA